MIDQTPAETMALLRRMIREAAKAAIYAWREGNYVPDIHIYDGTVNSVRFAIVSDDGKSETCYEVKISRLGKRRRF